MDSASARPNGCDGRKSETTEAGGNGHFCSSATGAFETYSVFWKWRRRRRVLGQRHVDDMRRQTRAVDCGHENHCDDEPRGYARQNANQNTYVKARGDCLNTAIVNTSTTTRNACKLLPKQSILRRTTSVSGRTRGDHSFGIPQCEYPNVSSHIVGSAVVGYTF